MVDHTVARQALEYVEVSQILPRLACQHGDPADRAMADGRTRARIQIWHRCEVGIINSSANSAAQDLIQINAVCGHAARELRLAAARIDCA